MAKNDAVIGGVKPCRGMYLIRRSRMKTYGRIVRVRDDGAGTVCWQSSSSTRVESPVIVRSNPAVLRENGYEYSERPLPGYYSATPFAHEDTHPEQEPEEVPADEVERVAFDEAAAGHYWHAMHLFRYLGNDEAVALCKRGWEEEEKPGRQGR